MDDIELLRQRGDGLERAIIGDGTSELVSILMPYAAIWRNYVLPHRVGIGNFTENKWSLSASSHYSALIRIHNTLTFKDLILCICTDYKDEGSEELSLQAFTAAFWWSLGAAVDNLGQVISNFPGSTITDDTEKDSGKKYICNQVPFLGYAYNRRTQQIHSRIVPIGAKDRYPMFDEQYLDGADRENLPASTEWKDAFKSPADLAKFYEDRWAEAIKEFTRAWHLLRTLLDGFAKKLAPKSIPDMKDFRWDPITFITPTASAFGPLNAPVRIPRSIEPEPPPPARSGVPDDWPDAS